MKTTNLPPIVSAEEWAFAREDLLIKEKAATRAHDALAAERRRLPMVLIDKKYAFEGPNGRATLPDLFDGKRQLLVYHFMFAPGVHGWPDAGCPGCSMFCRSDRPPSAFSRQRCQFCSGVACTPSPDPSLSEKNGLDFSLVLLVRERF